MNFNDDEKKWKVLDSKYLLKRHWLVARQDKVQLPNGKVYDEYYVLEYPTWINIIAETTEGNLILERQYRHSIGMVSTEIPAGVVENGETPLQAAQRELSEETGFEGGDWQEFMVLSPNASTMNNYSHTFLARGVQKVTQPHLDPTEDINVYLFSKSEVLEMLRRGDFAQALMVAPLWKYFSTCTDLLK